MLKQKIKRKRKREKQVMKRIKTIEDNKKTTSAEEI